MVSDAIWTGKPLALVPIANSALGRIVTVMDALRPGRRLYPQDLRFFWRALAEIGVNEQPGIPRTSTDEQIRSVLDRVRSLLGSKC
jgi:hypothetical protein